MTPGGTLAVLHVEDEWPQARLLDVELRQRGDTTITLIQVPSLAQALTRLDGGGIDAVLLDLSLPDSFGLDTLRAVIERHPGVPVVVYSGTGAPEAIAAAEAEGAAGYLVKGEADTDAVVALLHACVGR